MIDTFSGAIDYESICMLVVVNTKVESVLSLQVKSTGVDPGFGKGVHHGSRYDYRAGSQTPQKVNVF